MENLSLRINGVRLQYCYLKITKKIHRLKQASCLGVVSKGKGLGHLLMERC